MVQPHHIHPHHLHHMSAWGTARHHGAAAAAYATQMYAGYGAGLYVHGPSSRAKKSGCKQSSGGTRKVGGTVDKDAGGEHSAAQKTAAFFQGTGAAGPQVRTGSVQAETHGFIGGMHPLQYSRAAHQGYLHAMAGAMPFRGPYHMPFIQAVASVRTLGLESESEWVKWWREHQPQGIPINPDRVYQHYGWQGWDHWLGISHSSPFLPFDSARRFTHSLKLKNMKDWKVFCKLGSRPANIPANPRHMYRQQGWLSWDHWLGTGGEENLAEPKTQTKMGSIKARKGSVTGVLRTSKAQKGAKATTPHGGSSPHTDYLPFEEALGIVRRLELVSEEQWHSWCENGSRPNNVPPNPQAVYPGKPFVCGWQGYGHWLGTPEFWDCPEESVIRELKLPKNTDSTAFTLFRSAAQKTITITQSNKITPSPPMEVVEVKEVDGAEVTQAEHVEQVEGVEQNEEIGLAVVRETATRVRLKRVVFIDHQPTEVAAAGSATQSVSSFLPFDKALQHVRSLGLTGVKAWWAWCGGGERPANIPAVPERAYEHEGWQGYTHWLGVGNGKAEQRSASPTASQPQHRQQRPGALPESALDQGQHQRTASRRVSNAVAKEDSKPTVVTAGRITLHTPPQRNVSQRTRVADDPPTQPRQRQRRQPAPNFILPFEEALSAARSLNLKSAKEWTAWCNSGTRPSFIPHNPQYVYRNEGWKGWIYWLGKGVY